MNMLHLRHIHAVPSSIQRDCDAHYQVVIRQRSYRKMMLRNDVAICSARFAVLLAPNVRSSTGVAPMTRSAWAGSRAKTGAALTGKVRLIQHRTQIKTALDGKLVESNAVEHACKGWKCNASGHYFLLACVLQHKHVDVKHAFAHVSCTAPGPLLLPSGLLLPSVHHCCSLNRRR